MSDKDKVIRQIHHDPDGGFGSINDTFKQAHHILNTITVNHVKDFLSRQKSRQTESYRGFNSFVAKEPLQEIQMDLAVFIDSAPDNNGYKYAFVAVGIFIKMLWAVQIKDKRPGESVRAVKEVLENIGVPEVIYHDNEGSWSSTGFIRLINSHKIKQIITSTPPQFTERAIQTIKNMIHQRLDGLEVSKEKWVDMFDPVLKKYNNTKHSTTGLPPNESKKHSNHMEVWLNISNKATYHRRYPPLKVSDQVRVYQKPIFQKKV